MLYQYIKCPWISETKLRLDFTKFTKRKGEYKGKISISEKELNVNSRNDTYSGNKISKGGYLD